MEDPKDVLTIATTVGGLTGAEWLCLLPAPTSPLVNLSREAGEIGEDEHGDDEPREQDPGKDARDASPLTFALILATFWTLAVDSGAFSARGLAAGTAGFAIIELGYAFFTPRLVKAAVAIRRDLDRHPFARFVRWKQLCLAGADGRTPSSLNRHEPADPLCPCPAHSCANSRILGPSAAVQATFVLFRGLVFIGVFGALTFWTPLVLFGGETWTSPWRGILAACVVVQTIVVCYVQTLDGPVPDVELQGLQRRLVNRATTSALSSFLARCSKAGMASVNWPAVEPYVEVHLALVPSWRAVSAVTATGITIQAGLVGIIVCAMCVTVFGSGCIPAYLLGALLLMAAQFLANLSNVAAANAGVSRTALLYGRARTELQLILTRRPDHPEAARLREHALLLERFETAAKADLARVAGFPADYSVLRGIVVTALTVGVGLYGILRGAGVWVTVQSACPVV
ncbi:hypothetical protein DFJ74DRAFT_703142 [Hyaloraphidium curvatum]|nr:hypothetical protein DFJ74DRAFT_703142 [Hyaloraphidium curvatum]